MARLGQEGQDAAEQVAARDACDRGIVVGEVLADVSERRGAQKRVGQRVTDHVTVGVAGQAGLAGELEAPQEQGSALVEHVRVVTEADPLSHHPAAAWRPGGGPRAG
jgi:hypothetical protein